MVDTCAGEFSAETPYFYASYDKENEAQQFLDSFEQKNKLPPQKRLLGILLGGGGLVRAYSHGAKIAVDAGKPVTMAECVTYSITTDYTTYGKINYALDGWSVKLENSDFADDVTLTVVMKACHEQGFLDGMRELSAGKITPTLLSKSFRPY